MQACILLQHCQYVNNNVFDIPGMCCMSSRKGVVSSPSPFMYVYCKTHHHELRLNSSLAVSLQMDKISYLTCTLTIKGHEYYYKSYSFVCFIILLCQHSTESVPSEPHVRNGHNVMIMSLYFMCRMG